MEATARAAEAAYARAHEAHYSARDFLQALEIYVEIVSSFSGTREAEYARAQIRNIAQSVVPEGELLDSQVQLILARLRKPERSSAL